METELDQTVRRSPPRWRRVALLCALVTIVGLLSYRYREAWSLAGLASREAQLRAFQSQHPLVVYGVALAVYALATGVSLPGATALTLVYGWYFGWGPGVVLVSFASTLGATIAFLLSRYFLGSWVQAKYGDRLAVINQRLEEDGALYLLTLRLIFSIPFFVVNLLMGLTRLRVTTYWWASQLGMLPATCIYVYAGSRVPNLTVLADKGALAVFTPSQLLQFAVALGLLGFFPLAVKKLVGSSKKR